MPTGGISEAEVKTYLSLPNVFAIGGSWIASQEDIAAGNWGRIDEIARRSLALA
jgi:2-dehydro-3-deoxyphosphogluconate aldolase/(4S)-4-hydroxy-2-oxoglutarate aldolase